MGLLDELVGRATEALSHGQASGLAQNVLTLLQESGGIQGLSQRFQQQGLGDVISSWVGTGTNQPISAQQIVNVLGSDRVAALAQQAGTSPDEVSAALTQLLPTLIDKLTPNGQTPPVASLMQIGLSLLKNLK